MKLTMQVPHIDSVNDTIIRCCNGVKNYYFVISEK